MKKRFKSALSFDKGELAGIKMSMGTGIPIGNPVVIDSKSDDSFMKSMVESLGRFGDNNNYFDQNTTPASLIPKPDDFISVPFRLITATIVGAGTWKATDFSNASMLKKSVDMLSDKPLFYDHDTDLMNWVGLVKNPKWTSASKQGDLAVPAGIDGDVLIDAKTNPKLARGVLLGSIYSNSVTVEFEWEMSHTFENEWDFHNKVGTMGSDGKMVRRVVKKVTNYHESSLVWLGADPFAKARTEDGDLQHIDYTSIHVEFSKAGVRDSSLEDFKESRKIIAGYSVDENILHLSHASRKTQSKTKRHEDDMKLNATQEAALRKALGLSNDISITQEHFDKWVEQMSKPDPNSENFGKVIKASFVKPLVEKEGEFSQEKFDSVFGEDATHEIITKERLSELESISTSLGTDIESYKELQKKHNDLVPMATIGRDYIKAKRDEAVRLYKATVGEKVDESIVGLFEKADSKELDGLLKAHVTTATEKFGGKCNKCDSTEFTFQSSVTIPQDNEELELDSDVPSREDIRESRSTSGFGINA